MAKTPKNEKQDIAEIPLAADLAIAAWVVVVAVAYYGALINPLLFRAASQLAIAYRLLLAVSIAALLWNAFRQKKTTSAKLATRASKK